MKPKSFRQQKNRQCNTHKVKKPLSSDGTVIISDRTAATLTKKEERNKRLEARELKKIIEMIENYELNFEEKGDEMSIVIPKVEAHFTLDLSVDGSKKETHHLTTSDEDVKKFVRAAITDSEKKSDEIKTLKNKLSISEQQNSKIRAELKVFRREARIIQNLRNLQNLQRLPNNHLIVNQIIYNSRS